MVPYHGTRSVHVTDVLAGETNSRRPHRASAAMCGNNPNLAPEVNTAKCIGGTALGFAIVTVVGILLDWPGFISAAAGILSIIGNSIICCCGPKTKSEGSGKMMAGMVINIIACVFHFIAIILIIVLTLLVATSDGGGAAQAAVAGFIVIIASGTIVFSLVAGILEAVAAAKMSAARAAILKDGPSTATV